MGIDTPFLDRIVAIGRNEGMFPNGNVLILGDCRFHTSWASGDNAVDRERFREMYGLGRLETVDMFGAPSLRMDLHEPPPDHLRGQFDMVIDAGTLFCCFDVAAVLRGCFEMMKDEAIIVHLSGLTGYYGRCYYNFHPAMFRDLYEQNDFVITNMEIRVFKETCLAARLQQMWARWRRRPVGDYVRIDQSSTYVKYADFIGMEFTKEAAATPPMLPVDALILCAARRRERRAFTRPLPSYYRSPA
jgi:hypothetical protein